MKRSSTFLFLSIIQVFTFTHITAISNFSDLISKIALEETQSGSHARAYRDEIVTFFSYVNWDKPLIRLIDSVCERERIETKKGNYIFFHGRRWKWDLLADIFKKLWEIKNNKKVCANFQFLRFENEPQTLKDVEIEKRKGALLGRENNETGFADRLFMNHALFGYVGNRWRCSFRYMLDNFDKSSVHISIRDIFKHFNFESLYTKYEKKFEQLHNLHKRSSNYGSLLLISCTPEQVDKSVLPVHCKSGQRKAIIVQGQETYDPKKIVQALKINPCAVKNCNKVKYGLILTHDCALAPNNGPKIYSFHAADEKLFKKYKKLKEKIFEAIAKDVSIYNGV